MHFWVRKKTAKNVYGFNLRIGAVKVSELYALKHRCEVAKLALNDDYTQVIVRGGALSAADKMIKEDSSHRYQITSERLDQYEANFAGLECRWQDIPTSQTYTLTLIIQARKEEAFYKQILDDVQLIFGDVSKRHPISEQKLALSFNVNQHRHEAQLHPKMPLYRRIFKQMILNLLGWILMKGKIGAWKQYKSHLLQTCDTEKFDDSLRMVLSSDETNYQRFMDKLKTYYENGDIFYGLERSKSALMTCLIFERHGKQVHFVDGADGGYAMAAKALKAQIKRVSQGAI